MNTNSQNFNLASKGFKRASLSQKSEEYEEDLFNKPTKRIGFLSASKLTQDVLSEPEDPSFYKNYKISDKTLSTHWLFSDESPKKVDFAPSYSTQSKEISIATTRVPSIEEHTGFRFASGKSCNSFKFDKTDELRKFLGLDEEEPEEGEKKYVLPTATRFESPRRLRLPTSSTQTTSNTSDDLYNDTQYASLSIPDSDTTESSKFTYLDVWNEVATFTRHYTSNMSLDVLSTLWRSTGTPMQVTFYNVGTYKYLFYTHENEFVSYGGLREVMICFKKMVTNLNLKIKREMFDDTWIKEKFKILTLNSCRRYTQKIVKLYKNGDLHDSIPNVPLPNPINLLKKLIKCVKEESSGNYSPMKEILQGDTTPDVPVVLRIEGFDGTNVYLSDGFDIYKGVLTDNQIKSVFESNQVHVGNKILIQGINFKEVKGEFIISLSFNSISRANKRTLGIQPKHSNVNMKDLVVGGGRVSRVEVVVLRHFPLVYKVWYKCPETSAKRIVMLSENEYLELTHNPESEVIGLIERVSIQFTMFVMDAVMLSKQYNKDDFQRRLSRSCTQITLINVDDTISYILKPLTRFVITNTYISSFSSFDILLNGDSVSEPFRLSSTPYSKLDVLENKVQLPDSEGTGNELFKALFNGVPSLSMPENFDDHDEFMKLHFNFEKTNLFLGQVCDINGIVLHVGEVENSRRFCHIRFFVLTSKFHLVSVKVNYRNSLEQNEALSLDSDIQGLERKLKTVMLKVVSDRKGKKDSETDIFYSFCNLQYTGFDDQNGIYNFQVNCDQILLKRIKVLKTLQKYFNDKSLVFLRGNIHLSIKSFNSLKDTHLDNICKIFSKTVINNIIEVYRLVQFEEESIKELEMLTFTQSN